jgi:amino acid transporter
MQTLFQSFPANIVPVFTQTPWGSQGLTDFFTAYIGILVFVLLFGFWKIFKRTKMVNPANADIWSGKAALDAEVWPEYVPKNMLEKFWAWLC